MLIYCLKKEETFSFVSGYESNIAESYFDFTRVSETGYQKYQHQMTQWPIKSCCEDVESLSKNM